MKRYHVVAAILIHDGKLFACQRGYGNWKGWWEFPGGKVETGEAPEDALVREMKEELELDITVGEKLITVEYDYPDFHLSMDCFRSNMDNGSQPHLLEHEAARWLKKDELESVKWLPADLQIIDLLAGLDW